MKNVVIMGCLGLSSICFCADEPKQISGIYPSLAMFNNEGECGTGAVVPWADRLWVITYGPHLPFGSSDKLYEITPDLKQVIRPESVGGTPANRMIHKETQQLLIGPYVIDAERQVRVIPPAKMPGRLTGNARHLTDPAGKAYYATMEEGLYEVDLKTLEVAGFIQDGNTPKPGFSQEPRPATLKSELPGYHGKGLFSGQGRLVYANNGDRDKRVLTDPATPSGALGEWTTPGDDWKLVRRNQFTEVSGPGGISGNDNPATDPIWSVGWDHRSLILMCLHEGKWHSYRLPKSSHSYDGAHGWNTEWPRIRDVGEDDLLMTMHGAFWRFPKGFTPKSSAGLTPRSNYLKVIGDFARWQDRIVFGCDDSANKEFLNVRKAKGELAGPGQSQSNLWFVQPEQIDGLGPVIGRGAVWLEDAVKAGEVSEPFLFAGYRHRSLQLVADQSAAFILEVDEKGNGEWIEKSVHRLEKAGNLRVDFSADQPGVWVRLKAQQDGDKISTIFHYRNDDARETKAAAMFDGIAQPGDTNVTGGVLHARGGGFKTLRFISAGVDGKKSVYDMGDAFDLKPVEDAAGLAWTSKNAAIPEGVLTQDAASILYVDDKGRWRLPRGSAALDEVGPLGAERVCREVCTERDLFNAGGTFFELPAENAGGFAKIRPVTTHNRRIKDYASYRGLMVMSGLRKDAEGAHIVRSADGQTALWVGAVDDLWKFGKPRGSGGPWLDSAVKAGVPSDPYLFTGYDQKRLTLKADKPVNITVEADVTGTGLWVIYERFELKAGVALKHTFPSSFGAYWVRVVADQDATATAQWVYE
jgi:hypothetical protein